MQSKSVKKLLGNAMYFISNMQHPSAIYQSFISQREICYIVIHSVRFIAMHS